MGRRQCDWTPGTRAIHWEQNHCGSALRQPKPRMGCEALVEREGRRRIQWLLPSSCPLITCQDFPLAIHSDESWARKDSLYSQPSRGRVGNGARALRPSQPWSVGWINIWLTNVGRCCYDEYKTNSFKWGSKLMVEAFFSLWIYSTGTTTMILGSECFYWLERGTIIKNQYMKKSGGIREVIWSRLNFRNPILLSSKMSEPRIEVLSCCLFPQHKFFFLT